jgi:hypothetical protein
MTSEFNLNVVKALKLVCQLLIILFNTLIMLTLLFLSRLTPKAFKGVLPLSFLEFQYFFLLDWHISQSVIELFLKAASACLALFQSYMQIREIYQPIGTARKHSAVFKRVLTNSKIWRKQIRT